MSENWDDRKCKCGHIKRNHRSYTTETFSNMHRIYTGCRIRGCDCKRFEWKE